MHLRHGDNHRPVPRVGQPHVQVRLIQVECKRRIEPAQRNQHITPDRNIGALGLDGAVRWVNHDGSGTASSSIIAMTLPAAIAMPALRAALMLGVSNGTDLT